MKASELLDSIKDDIQKLSVYKSKIEQKLLINHNDSNSISYLMTKYNYDNFNEILNSNSIDLNFEVGDEKLKDFQHRIDTYLNIYAPGDADLRQYIIGISTYLAFIARRPLHPPGLEFSNGAKVFEKDGSFYCSGKRIFIKEDLSLCKYCVCRSKAGDLRIYGTPPFSVVVVHGGPGAAGSMAPVARELSKHRGVLEPLQTALSIDGQIIEMHDVLMENSTLPITLIGHSWGAWLSLIFAARYPQLVKKLILVGCGPIEEKYALTIMGTRLGRLSGEEIQEVRALTIALNDPKTKSRSKLFSCFGKLMSKADAFDPMPGEEPELVFREDINASVWAEAEALRRNSGLIKIVGQIRCPIVAIHGDYDPHPAEGVEKPLARAIKDFRFILLEKCGHEPWHERFARDRFFKILEEELS